MHNVCVRVYVCAHVLTQPYRPSTRTRVLGNFHHAALESFVGERINRKSVFIAMSGYPLPRRDGARGWLEGFRREWPRPPHRRKYELLPPALKNSSNSFVLAGVGIKTGLG